MSAKKAKITIQQLHALLDMLGSPAQVQALAGAMGSVPLQDLPADQYDRAVEAAAAIRAGTPIPEPKAAKAPKVRKAADDVQAEPAEAGGELPVYDEGWDTAGPHYWRGPQTLCGVRADASEDKIAVQAEPSEEPCDHCRSILGDTEAARPAKPARKKRSDAGKSRKAAVEIPLEQLPSPAHPAAPKIAKGATATFGGGISHPEKPKGYTVTAASGPVTIDPSMTGAGESFFVEVHHTKESASQARAGSPEHVQLTRAAYRLRLGEVRDRIAALNAQIDEAETELARLEWIGAAGFAKTLKTEAAA